MSRIMAKAKKKLNGVHVEVTREKDEATIQRELMAGRGNRRALAKAMETVRKVAKKTNGFHNLKGHSIVLVVDAALQDAFVPLPKLKLRKHGNRLDNAIKLIQEGATYAAQAQTQN